MSNDTDIAGDDGYSFHPRSVHGEPASREERDRRETYLAELRALVCPEADEIASDPQLSHAHDSWEDWLEATGELPPDFERMPARATLPDPLEREEDGEWTRIADRETWERQRERLKGQLEYWIYGSMPPAPENLTATVLETRDADGAEIRDVELAFGPDREATMGIEVMVPDGEGPHPVFMTQWNHRKWAEIALERGYLGVVYAGADRRDDTAEYPELYPDHDFQVLARRAWGASRVVDYLETLEAADEDRIALTGHSRNGKQSLIAAAFDERIAAVVPSSSGTGGAVPARFDRDDLYAGDMSYHARLRRSWFHPRWRFFVGRENRLPVDANSLVSLVAPRACMLATARNEVTASAWAVDRVYESARSVYDLLEAADRLAFHARGGDHGTATRDIEAIVDFFDFAFDRGAFGNPTRRYHAFDRDRWRERSGTTVDPEAFPPQSVGEPLESGNDGAGEDGEDGGARVQTIEEWSERREEIRDALEWTLGERPPRASDSPSRAGEGVSRGYGRPDYVAEIIGRPEASDAVGKRFLSPYHTAGKPFGGDLYYPREEGAEPSPDDELPAILWLHPFSYNTGYGTAGRGQVPLEEATDRGFALFAFDGIGFGTRMREGERFYDRHPTWSKMGKLVADTRAAIETLRDVEYVDPERVYVLGYSLGATVGLYAAALDERIRGVASVCGFSSLRASDPESERAHGTIRRLSDLHGLQPRLGEFLEAPERIPVDFDEMLGAVAPRPALVVAPDLDWTIPQEDVRRCVEGAREVYDLHGAEERLEYREPFDALSFDYHETRFTTAVRRSDPDREFPACMESDRRREVFDWLEGLAFE